MAASSQVDLPSTEALSTMSVLPVDPAPSATAASEEVGVKLYEV